MTIESADNNPYSPPKSGLELDNTQGAVPSISEALSRGYDFSIGDVLSEAWSKVRGSKGTIIGATLLVFAVACALIWIIAIIDAVVMKAVPVLETAIQFALQIVFSALLYPDRYSPCR